MHPRLILDFSGYNSVSYNNSPPIDQGVYWVGDLAFSATLKIEEQTADGEVLLELVEGDRQYRCQIDPAAGTATLSYLDTLDRNGDEQAAHLIGTGQVPIRGPGTYTIQFANIDDQLWLVVDGNRVEFDNSTYVAFASQLIQRPQASDLTPVGVAVKNLTATVSGIKLERDLYYRSEAVLPQMLGYIKEVETESNERVLRELANAPSEYTEFYHANAPLLNGGMPVRFTLDDNEYLMLGDNSARSQDSRLWANTRNNVHRHAVPRNYLVGKALLIFWPHGLRVGNVKEGIPHGYTIPKMDWLFYHREEVGNTTRLTDYQAFGLPFYPDFARWFERIR